MRIGTIDILRGITILWIAAFHFYVDTRGAAGDVSSQTWSAAYAARDAAALVDLFARTLVALPSYRLDLLLFVTGLVLGFSRQPTTLAFWRRRAEAVMPNYWTGSLAAVALLVAMAAIRAVARETPLATEIADGTLLARAPYHFAWVDVLLSLSVAGRLSSARAMQVMAPSMWYVLLVIQLYLLYPVLKWVMARTGPVLFVAVCLGISYALRSAVIGGLTPPDYDVRATLIYFVPLRLAGPAFGMATGCYLHHLPQPSRRVAALLFVPALALLAWSIWFGSPVGDVSAWGAMPALLAGIPSLWLIASAFGYVPGLARLLTRLGVQAMSLLVVQDLLRLVTGTVMVLWGRLDPWTWYLMPFYLAAAVALTPVWQRVPEATLRAIRRPAARAGGESSRL